MGVPASTGKTRSGVSVGDGNGVGVRVGWITGDVGGKGLRVAAGITVEAQDTSKPNQRLTTIDRI
jgi:hypothetical protein